MRPYHQQVPRWEREFLQHDPVHHFLHQLLTRLLVPRIVYDVDQFVRVVGEIEEFFSVIAAWSDRVAELRASERFFPWELHGQIVEGRLAQAAKGLG